MSVSPQLRDRAIAHSGSGEPPSAKRQKVDDSSRASHWPIAVPSLTRSYIWMTYGDVVLQAEWTIFCVNRDILMRKSAVFNYMLDIKQPSAKTFEGRRFLQLPDSAKDIQLLLDAFYNSFNDPLSMSFDELSCKLRLGRIYKAHEFERNALHFLESQFPHDLPTLDRMENKLRLDWIAAEPGVHVDLLNLAYENGVHTCIPMMAFHCLSLYSLSQLFSGIERNDGSYAMLPEQTKLMLALAIEAIILFQRDNLKWLRKKGIFPVRNCLDPVKCERERKNMCLIESTGVRMNVSYMLEEWGKVQVDGRYWGNGLCAACKKVAQTEYNAGRVRLWEELPTFFGLAQWHDLRDAE
ncbi:hypothetical protein GGX14DRAFT_585929 [Mycena pura]|uniref:BTB domain-containing protein n=1 Tax=Mycena pura TaxID=153505 RepID=A0AAD6VU45_9AGAR|nr:hypothetical protein GGX14DRAFT_585929 [Mycena pura]